MSYISSLSDVVEATQSYKWAANTDGYEDQAVALANDLVEAAERLWSIARRDGLEELEVVDTIAMIFETLEQDTPDQYPNLQAAFIGTSELKPQEGPLENTLGHRAQKLLKKIQRQFWLDSAFLKAARNGPRSGNQNNRLKFDDTLERPPARSVITEQDVESYRRVRAVRAPFSGVCEVVQLSLSPTHQETQTQSRQVGKPPTNG